MKSIELFSEFESLVERIFADPYARLDALLSRCTPENKNTLASVIPVMLRRPVSVDLCKRFPTTVGELLQDRSKVQALLRLEHDEIPYSEGCLEDFPEWMVQEWRQDFGGQILESLASILTQSPPLTFRWNRYSEAEMGSPGWSKTSWSPLGMTRSDYLSIYPNDPKNKGKFEIQDEGSQMMSLFALDPSQVVPHLSAFPQPPALPQKPLEMGRTRSSLRVVDACAGAGGKTLALAALMKGFGQIVAYDVSESKVRALKSRAGAAGFHSVKALRLEENAESSQIEKFYQKSDLVLIDAPCSGWGVLRRNPQIKYQMQLQDLERLTLVQDRLLDLYSQLVKPGGRLVYGTCTFRKAETTARVDAFSQRQKQWKQGTGGYFGPGPMDGFFMQEWVRLEG